MQVMVRSGSITHMRTHVPPVFYLFAASHFAPYGFQWAIVLMQTHMSSEKHN